MSAIPAAKHTLQVIRYLAGHSGPVRASTIARDLSLARSTAYHLLRVLQDEGFVIHSPEHQAYGLSPLLAEIGSSVSASVRRTWAVSRRSGTVIWNNPSSQRP